MVGDHENDPAELGWPVIRRLIGEAAALGDIKEIGFVGGEPFLELDTLMRAVKLCSASGLRASVVTNGFWADNVQNAENILEKLRGLTNLSVSTDSFHQEFIPVDRIRAVISACRTWEIDCDVYLSHLNDPVLEATRIKEQLAGMEGLYTLKMQPVISLGRAAMQIDKNSLYTYDPHGMCCPCVDSPMVSSNGNVVACCGGATVWPSPHPLILGNIHRQTLGEIRRTAILNPVVHILRLRGPGELVRLVRNKAEKEGNGFVPPPSGEIRDICSLCNYIVTDPNYAGLLQRAVWEPEAYHEIAAACLMECAEIALLREEGNFPGDNARISRSAEK